MRNVVSGDACRGPIQVRAQAFSVAALAFALAGCGGSVSYSVNSDLSVQPSNGAPTITSPASATVPEDTAGVFYQATATDPNGQAVTFSITGGVDQAQFRITPGGALAFATPPDFEAPTDANRDNLYLLTIGASDGTLTATRALTVAVTDVLGTPFRVRRVTSGMDFPLFLAPVPDGTGRVFVVERAGRIRILTPSTGAIAATPFIDLTGQVGTDGERGLLGFATAPDFATSGRFYVYLTQLDGTVLVRRYQTFFGDRDHGDLNSGDTILRVLHPRSNHNGGWIGFGPDNLLYIAIGDGGGAGDPDNNAQNTNVILGKILRIDPTRDDFTADADRDYGIPAGNPFPTGGAPEVWAYGLRNPFRCSFDPLTGNLLIADVGQNSVEEIDVMRPTDAGANFGWPILEGTSLFRGGSTAGLTPPVAQYSAGTGPLQGNSVTGGYVYRGPIESLRGQYFFADFVQPNLWSLPVSRMVPGTTLASTDFTVRTVSFAPDVGAINNVASFGVDQAGQLYIVDFDGEIFVVEAVPGATPTAAALGTPQPILSQDLARRMVLRAMQRPAR